MSEPIFSLFADEDGNILDAPLYGMGRIGDENVKLKEADIIPIPESADLFLMPGCRAVGLDENGTKMPIDGFAVSAILPAGYTSSFIKTLYTARRFTWMRTRNGILCITTRAISRSS